MNPYNDILKLTQNTIKDNNNITTGKVLAISPLKVLVGELEYESEDIKILKDVYSENPQTVQIKTGDVLFMISLDDSQSFYVLGRL